MGAVARPSTHTKTPSATAELTNSPIFGADVQASGVPLHVVAKLARRAPGWCQLGGRETHCAEYSSSPSFSISSSWVCR